MGKKKKKDKDRSRSRSRSHEKSKKKKKDKDRSRSRDRDVKKEKKKKKDEKRKAAKKGFKELLKETEGIDHHSHWSDFKKMISEDPRYVAWTSPMIAKIGSSITCRS